MLKTQCQPSLSIKLICVTDAEVSATVLRVCFTDRHHLDEMHHRHLKYILRLFLNYIHLELIYMYIVLIWGQDFRVLNSKDNNFKNVK